MTVAQIMENMSAREFDMWQAFSSFNPIGDLRGDIQSANVARAFQGGDNILDFMPVNPQPKTKAQKLQDANAQAQLASQQMYDYMTAMASIKNK